MKIDFGILWVDDNLEFIEPLRDHLQNWMDEHGFRLVIYAHKNEDGIYDDLNKRVIELIVIDYRLPKKTGDQLILEIRNRNYYQDIIFYSQGELPSVQLDGVFFVAKDDAKQRIKDLLELRIRRASDLPTLRGWIVADCIELERMLDAALAKCFQEKEELFLQRVLSHENLFDFGKKQIVLSGIIKDAIGALAKSSPNSARATALRKHQETLNEFALDIIRVRNTLAHQMEEAIEGGKVELRMRGKKEERVEFTPELCAKVRKNIHKHRENLVGLYNLLCEG